MLYPTNIEEKIGFNKIKNYLKDYCEGEIGISLVDKIQFTSDFKTIDSQVKQTDEFVKILTSRDFFPAGEYFNLRKYLIKASKIDAYLLNDEFHEVKLSLIRVEEILKFFKKRASDYPQLSLLTIGIYLNPQITHAISQVIDERGNIRNTASEILLNIRNQLQKHEFKVRSKLENILKKYVTDGYSNDDSTITIRNGRLVLPVRAEFKRVVSGFIHDESSTGQTAFIEPSNVVEINNDIRDLIHQEKREIIRILISLTDLIRPEIENLEKCNHFLGLFDFIKAKAKLAIELNAILPELSQKTRIDWKQARHPLLYLAHQKAGKEIVPLDITLSRDIKILVISGPNAGGKSVCLQTVGLLQYMIQCGLLVPMAEGSTIGVYKQLFIDIGDEQSLENDLSTYSSHLINMKFFMKNATPSTLFLIDEFGTGTEPQFGGAIAESILENMREKKVSGIITTHYTNLKKYAENHDGVMNGAMRFDIKKMEPLFILEVGKPGSSFALEIAKKIGLSQRIIDQAKRNIGTTHVKFERLIAELEEEKHEFSSQKHNLEVKEKELKKLVEEYESIKNYINLKRDELIKEAGKKADQLIKEANREIEKTIRIIKEEKAEKDITKKVRKSLKDFRENIVIPKNSISEQKKESKITPEKVPGPLKANDYVKLLDSKTYGIVLSIKGKKAQLAIGDLKSSINLSRLVKVSASEYKKEAERQEKNYKRAKGVDINEKRKNFSTILDLRGRRAEEAKTILANYLDDAILLDVQELRILHGKGEGILREVIRNFLKQNEYIASIQDEHVEKGGAGITIITLQ